MKTLVKVRYNNAAHPLLELEISSTERRVDVVREGFPIVFVKQAEVSGGTETKTEELDLDHIRGDLQENIDRHHEALPPLIDERFNRAWRYYLLSLAGAFRARRVHLWQLVLSRHGVLGGYESIR